MFGGTPEKKNVFSRDERTREEDHARGRPDGMQTESAHAEAHGRAGSDSRRPGSTDAVLGRLVVAEQMVMRV